MKSIFFVIMLALMMIGCGTPAQQAAETKAQGPDYYLSEGVQYLKEANVTEAIKNFDEAIRLDPLDVRGYMVLGQTYMRLQDPSRAVDTFSAAARVAPQSGEIQYLLAVNYGLISEMELAKKSAQRSAELFRAQQDEKNFAKSLLLFRDLSNATQEPEQVVKETVAVE